MSQSDRFHKQTRFLFVAGLALFLVASFAGVARAADEGGGGDGQPLVIFMINALGWIFGPLAPGRLGRAGRAIVLLALDLRMSAAIPPGFVDEFTDTVNKRKFKEAFDMARNDPSFLGRVLTAGMSRLQYGLEDAREAAMNTLESIKSDKEQKNNYTAVIATLGPMLGLVGTVFGMIQSFTVLAIAGTHGRTRRSWPTASRTPSSSRWSASAISVPAIFFNAFFRNRITRVLHGRRPHRRRPADADVPQLEEAGRTADPWRRPPAAAPMPPTGESLTPES